MSGRSESNSHSPLGRGKRAIWYDRHGNPVSPESASERTFDGTSPYSRRRRGIVRKEEPTGDFSEEMPLSTSVEIPEEPEVEEEPLYEDTSEELVSPEWDEETEESEPQDGYVPDSEDEEPELDDYSERAQEYVLHKRPLKINGIVYLVILYLAPLIALTAGGVVLFGKEKASEAPLYDMAAFSAREPFTYLGSFGRDFGDLNDIQLEAAKRIGITPASTREELKKRSGLVRVSESPTLYIDRLTHSQALLVPDAAVLLNEIGAKFTSRLSDAHLPLYSIIVTSITRTAEDVNGLRKGNGNASDNSTHVYGTTFDISWKRFHKVDRRDPRDITPEELKHLLAIVLDEFHDAGRCYIKHERYQACFHITTIK